MANERVLLDTNLYINLLLSRNEDGTAVGLILQAAAQQDFDLLLPEDVVDELGAVVARRAYLRDRISQARVDAPLVRLREFGIGIPVFDGELPQVCRDPGDDYIIAVAVHYGASLIVTRDKDLLTLAHIGGMQIVDPVAFMNNLRSME